MTSFPKRKLGQQGLEVSALGRGCMGMSQSYGDADESKSIATIHRALDLGGSAMLTLDPAEMDKLDRALAPGKVAGPRYNERLMATIDR